jgi:hypothetical protein
MAKSKLVDMEMDDEASMDYPTPIDIKKPRHSYGLRICLCDNELDKLKLDLPSVGDIIDLRAFATVTAVSHSEGGKRVELQIEKLGLENESDE